MLPCPRADLASDQPNGTNSRKLTSTSRGLSSKPWKGTQVTRSHWGWAVMPNQGPLAIAITTIQSGHVRIRRSRLLPADGEAIHDLRHAFRLARQLNGAIVLCRGSHHAAHRHDVAAGRHVDRPRLHHVVERHLRLDLRGDGPFAQNDSGAVGGVRRLRSYLRSHFPGFFGIDMPSRANRGGRSTERLVARMQAAVAPPAEEERSRT